MQIDKCELLRKSKNIVIVGLSSNSFRISRDICRYLIDNGYNVVGVNPNINFKEADGIVVFNNLAEVPFPIDIVNVFRKSEDIPHLIDDILKVKPLSVWLQLGIRNDTAVMPLIENGIFVVQDSCIKVDHSFCN